jgi:hypothetical protein
MRKKFALSVIAGLFLLSVLTVGNASALIVSFDEPMSLADLIKGSRDQTQYQIDDKLFYGFSYTPSGDGVVPTAAAITVTPLNDVPLNPGLQFNGYWGAGQNQTADGTIRYYVQVLEGGNAITDFYLDFTGGTVPGGVAGVDESVQAGNSGGVFLANLHVGTSDSGAYQDTQLLATPTMGPLYVVKDIGVGVPRGLDGTATISQVTNRISETPVPLPSALLLLAPGLAGLAWMRRRLSA